MHPTLFAGLTTFPIAGLAAIPRRGPASPADQAPERSVAAVTLNLAKETDPDRIVRAIHRAPRLHEADFFLLQEVAHEDGRLNVADATARRLGHFASFAAAPNACDQGLAIVSRYPLRDVEVRGLKRCDLRFRKRRRFVIAATAHTPWGDLRIWNAHLDTRINARERIEQLRPVLDDAAGYDGPGLIGGDFNTNDVYWLRNIVPVFKGPSHGAAIRAAMKQHGFETPLPNALNTYPALRRHLDWIFARRLRALESSVEPAAFSDHNAIWVRLGF